MSITVYQTCPGLSSGTEASQHEILCFQTTELSYLPKQGSFISNVYQQWHPGPAGFHAMPGKHPKDYRHASNILTV